uniref:Uncharacterized protein n=1 Tax=Anguilla anguilla TaxID=7936 RepID=A0A0E9TNR7_ANGAN
MPKNINKLNGFTCKKVYYFQIKDL